MAFVFMFYLFCIIICLGLMATGYILNALALSALRKGRESAVFGLHREDAWKAWVPFANMWLMGDIADDINRYNGKRSCWRLWLLLATALPAVIYVPMLLFVIYMAVALTESGAYSSAYSGGDAFMVLLSVAFMLLFYAAIIAGYVCQGIVYYHIFKDYAQQNSTLYLVLSILFPVCGIIFLFVIRHKPSFTLWRAVQPVPPAGRGGPGTYPPSGDPLPR